MHVAIVVPRYGSQVVGGAETYARSFAQEAASRGWTVEVWTTCAQSHYTWDNEYSPGAELCDGVRVHRFPVTRVDSATQARLDTCLASLGQLSVEDQLAWLESGAQSDPLYAHVFKHSSDVDLLVVIPYAASLSHQAAWIARGRTVVWPCLHDEPYAYLEPVRLLLESVWGVMFLSPEEGALALKTLRIQPKHCGVIGGGLPAGSARQLPARSLLDGQLLYVGRLEEGKNLATLYRYVIQCVEDGLSVRLVVVGTGPFPPPDHPAIESRGFVPELDKAVACSQSLALCQPSLNESFSITMMESWNAGRPVLVHEDCSVTRGHVQRSKGGLWFGTYAEFREAVEWLQDHPHEAAQMGQNGREYVQRNFTWPVVIDRFEQLVHEWDDGLSTV